MSSRPAHRRRSSSRISRVLQSLVFVLPLTVPVLVVLASPDPSGVVPPKDDIVISTGQTGDVVTAFGSTRQTATVAVYRRFDLVDLPPDVQLRLDSGSVRVTSPGGIPLEGTVEWSILAVNPDGMPGAPYGGGQIDVNQVPPGFPSTSGLPFDLGPDGLTLPPGVTSFFLCIETDNAAVHIGGYVVQGNTLYVRFDDGPLQSVSDTDISAELSGEIMGPTPSATATATPMGPTPTPQPDVVVQVVPQGGAGAGAGQAFFDTLMDHAAPESVDALLVDVRLDPRGPAGFTLVENLQIGPGTTARNLIGDSLEAFGQVRVVSQIQRKSSHDVEPLSQAVIFATLPDGREFGQYFQAMPVDAAQPAGETSLLFTTHDPVRYRVNVGVSAVADGTRVRLTPLGDGGVELASPQTVELDDGGSTQVNDIDSAWGLGGVPNVMVRIEVLAGAAFPYASVLDGRGAVPGTSDPTTILPVTVGARQVVLLEMGRITGLDEFSGSAMVYNHNAGTALVDVSFHQRGTPGVSATASFNVAGNSVVSWDDAVGDLVDRTGVVGSLVFELRGSPRGAISAIGREFAIFTDGGAVVGTAGQLLPGLAPADRLMPGETFHFIGLRDRQTPQGRERSHLGVLNLGDVDVTMTVGAYADDGAFEGMIQRAVRAGEQLRVNNVLRAANPSVDDGVKRIDVTADGPLHVLAYRVNPTGDPVTLRPFRR